MVGEASLGEKWAPAPYVWIWFFSCSGFRFWARVGIEVVGVVWAVAHRVSDLSDRSRHRAPQGQWVSMKTELARPRWTSERVNGPGLEARR